MSERDDGEGPSWADGLDVPVFIASGSQVSTRIVIPSPQEYDAVRRALATVDAVHGDGLLRTVPVRRNRARSEAASYEWSDRTGEPLRLTFSALAPRPELSIIHEIGHCLDHAALGDGPHLGSETKSIQVVMEEIFVSVAYQRLAELASRKQVRLGLPGRIRSQVILVNAATVQYLREPRELFARAYAQLIATASQNDVLLAQLGQVRADPVLGGLYHSQWDEQDFVPIMRAFEQDFRSRRWIE